MVLKKLKQAFSKKENPEYIEIELGKEVKK